MHNLLVWTDDRCEELDDLQTLLCEVARINSGSNCLYRIRNCIELAEKLRLDDLDTGRDGFYRFLQNLAIKNRTESKGE